MSPNATIIDTAVKAATGAEKWPEGGRPSNLENEAPERPTVEVADADVTFIRKQYLTMFNKQMESNRALEAVCDTLWKVVWKAVERGGNDLPMVRAYFEAYAAKGEDEWQRRDRDQRIKDGEIDKGVNETRTMREISGTYVTYKSAVVSGLSNGISPDEKLPKLEGESEALGKFGTIHEYMKASKAKAKASRAPRPPKPVKLSTVQTGLTEECNALIGRMLADMKQVPLDEQNATFELLLQQFSVTIANTLADYRVQHGEAKSGKVATATTGDPAADKAAGEAIEAENQREQEAPQRKRTRK